jgi:CBS-domain-containing membrane protein
MFSYLNKFRGEASALPPRATARQIALAWLGGGFVSTPELLSLGLLLGSFGASCVLVFGYPELPFSQPRNVLVGHLLSSLTGLLFLHAVGPQWWSLSLAVGSAIALMMLARSVHPPAGSNPVIIFLALPGWDFLLFPTLFGSLLLIAVALLYNNAARGRRYPQYW